MRKYKFIGTFISYEGHTYQLTAYCSSFIQAFFLLTADAIRLGKHYQLSTISDEKDNVKKIGDILEVGKLIV
jgi:hypothetical protein